MSKLSETSVSTIASPKWWDWDERDIVSEDAENEVWQRLSTYTYEPNIKRYWDEKGLVCCNEGAVTDWIAGCFRQARAYFSAGNVSPLDIRPLLYYYGTTTLLAGLSALMQAQEPPIKGHGMKLNDDSSATKLSNFQIKILPEPNGALSHFTTCFSPESKLAHSGSWSLMEIFGSLPDLKADFKLCYPNTPIFCHAVEPIRMGKIVVERLSIEDLRQAHGDEKKVFPLIHRAEELYLPQWTENYLSLSPKLGQWKEVLSAGWVGLDGRKYLQLGHQKNKQLFMPHLLMFYLIGLYALGFLSRYKPQTWNPFVLQDKTGERLVIERFLSSAARNVPNFALDYIQQCRIHFIAPGADSRSPILTTQEIESKIASEVKKQVEAWKRQHFDSGASPIF